MPNELLVGVDVGTGSVRAGVFDRDGHLQGLGSSPIALWRLPPDLAEQSSSQIWEAAGCAVREALRQAGLTGSDVAGLGFDATCSLVVLDEHDNPLSISPTGEIERNVVVWMDHRAEEQAERINATGHEVLRYVGGGFSPEQQPPKLLWLKENTPETYRKARRFMDLSDFLSYRATGEDVRSLCTTVCKWSYLGHENRWDEQFFITAGLEELADGVKIGSAIRSPGTPIGALRPDAADELGLSTRTRVAAGIIDADAGALGVFGMTERDLGRDVFERTMALIAGTSSCHLAVAPEPRFLPGVWGPYFGALLPGLWLNEGGQSATGALLDHVLVGHPASTTLLERAEAEGTTPYSELNRELERLSGAWPPDPTLTFRLHVLPYFLGNRSPRADAHAVGMMSGLRIDPSLEGLARLYYASIQALAYGTRHILEAFGQAGYRISRLNACGGATKNPVWLQEHADVTGCTIVLPREREAVMLGAAMLAAVAAGVHPDLPAACVAMGAAGEEVVPRSGVSKYHEQKYRVFHRMYRHGSEYDAIMAGRDPDTGREEVHQP